MLHRDRVSAAPAMTEQHWDELSKICASRECFPALLGHIMSLGQELFNSTLNMPTGTPEQKEQVDKIKGQVIGYQALVGQICDNMGDAEVQLLDEEEDARHADFDEGPRKRYIRAITPQMKVTRTRTSRAKTAKKAVKKVKRK